jgi:hypothetical protein
VKKIRLYQDGQKGVRSSPRFDDLRGRRVRIWSYEHGLYWRPKAQGYTAVPGEAGEWDFDTAYHDVSCCSSDEQQIAFEVVGPDPLESPVSSPYAPSLIEIIAQGIKEAELVGSTQAISVHCLANRIIAAIEASGRVVVPVEPTDEMMAAGDNEYEWTRFDNGTFVATKTDPEAVWRAMVEARPR